MTVTIVNTYYNKPVHKTTDFIKPYTLIFMLLIKHLHTKKTTSIENKPAKLETLSKMILEIQLILNLYFPQHVKVI